MLPTARSARFSSGLSVLDFMKRTTISRMTPAALAAIGPAAERLARAEGLEAHGLSVPRPARPPERGMTPCPTRADGPDRLIEVTLDETGLAPPTPEIEQERRVAIFDLLEENRFALPRARRPPGAARPLPAAPRDPRAAARLRASRPRTARRPASSTFR